MEKPAENINFYLIADGFTLVLTEDYTPLI